MISGERVKVKYNNHGQGWTKETVRIKTEGITQGEGKRQTEGVTMIEHKRTQGVKTCECVCTHERKREPFIRSTGGGRERKLLFPHMNKLIISTESLPPNDRKDCA